MSDLPPPVNVKAARLWLRSIETMAAYDDEQAHSTEDLLHQLALGVIADGAAEDPAALARCVLESGKIAFGRWYA